MNPARFLIAVAAAVCGAVIGLVLRDAMMSSIAYTPGAPGKPPSPAVVQTTGLADTDNSLTITSQRARQYPARPVAIETAPQPAGGYSVGTISYQSDGLKIYAQTLLPTTPKPPTGYPTLILVHGYVNPLVYQTDEAFYTQLGAEYARRGFLVIKPDLRGYGKSWGNPEGAYYSSGYVTDVLNLDASLANYPLANASDVGLLGHSMGGHIALVAALVRPDDFRALVLAAPADGRQADMYAHWNANSDFGNPVTLGIRQRVLSLFGPPSPGSDFWRQTDPYMYLADLSMPIEIHHATDDDTIPYRFSADLAAALIAAGHAPSLETYEVGGHSFTGPARDRLVATSAKFLATNLALKGAK